MRGQNLVRVRVPPRLKTRLAAVLVVVVVAGLAAGGMFALRPLGVGSASATHPPRSAAPVGSTEAATPTRRASSAASPSPTPPGLVAIVPVVGFWSSERSISRAELASIFAAGSGTAPTSPFQSIAVDSAEFGGLAAALGAGPAATVKALSADDVKAAVRGKDGVLGVIPASDVTPDVRALAVDGVALFGAGRIHDLASWPLMVAANSATTPFSAASIWTLAAGGDVMLDRSAYATAILQGKGMDYPWNGGDAVIDRLACCGFNGASLAVGQQTGSAGAFRSLLTQSDLAIVNLEGPAPADYSYHPDGFTFTMDPAMLVGLRDTGIDAVSLANNHMGNAGATGVTDTIRNLDSLGIAHAGAGSTPTAARQPAWLEAGGLRIALLAYDAIQTGYWAVAGRPGTAGLRLSDVTADVKAAKATGADLVIVMPHWGTEYTDETSAVQRSEAAEIAASGADLVLGSHSHWVGPVQSIARSGGPAFVMYSLGDLVFDLNHDVRTQEGVVADLTFVGTRLAQVDLQPTLILDRCQPNLLDPAGDGSTLLNDVRKASAGLLDW